MRLRRTSLRGKLTVKNLQENSFLLRMPHKKCRGTVKSFLYFVFILKLFSQSIEVLIVDSELKTIISDLKLSINDSSFYSDGSFKIPNSKLGQNLRISHLSYNDTTVLIVRPDIFLRLRKKIYQELTYEVLERKIYDNKTRITLNKDDRNNLNVTDLFESELNVNHNSYSGYGTLNQFRIRGASPDHTIVMIEGVRLNNFQNGGYNLSSFSLNQVSEIEIYKSGASAKNGSDAMGGVINFKMGSEQKNNIYFHETIASYKTFSHKLGFNHKLKNTEISASYNAKQSDNYFPSRISKSKIGYRNYSDFNFYSFDLRIKHHINDHSELMYFGMLTKNDVGTPGAGFVTAEKFKKGELRQVDKNFFNLLSYKNALSEDSELKITFSHFPTKLTFDKKQHYNLNENSVGVNYQTTYTKGLLGKINYEFHNSKLEADRGSGSFNAYRERHSFVISLNQKINSFFYDLSLRQEIYGKTNPFLDDKFYSINQFKKQSSPLIYDLSLKYFLSEEFSFSINSGKHYRKPTFNQLYWPSVDGNVKSEFAYSNAVYLNYQKQNIKATVNLFKNHYDDLIVWTNTLNTINLSEVEQFGAELNLSAEFVNHQLNMQFLYNRFYNVETDQQVNHTPNLSFALNYSNQFDALKIKASFKWNNQYFLRNGFEHPDEYTVNTYVAYQIKYNDFDLNIFNRLNILLNTYNNQLNIYSPPFLSYPKAGFRFEFGLMLNFNLMRN